MSPDPDTDPDLANHMINLESSTKTGRVMASLQGIPSNKRKVEPKAQVLLGDQ